MRFVRPTAISALSVIAMAIGLFPALADKRVALIIGNSQYIHVTRLENPVNDARLMANTLRDLGFNLIGESPQLDLDKAEFDRVVLQFGHELQGADVGLFYYAGHGLQVRGANYLVPIGANPTREADVAFQMFDANLVLRQMEGSGTKLNIVILDACRNNPFGGRGLRATNNGLAKMLAPEGTLISFATQPGNVAQDGADGNSPYATALAQTIRKPGVDIFRTFNEVGLAVTSATAGVQQPWVSASPIKGDFYFAEPIVPVNIPPVVINRAPQTDPDADTRREYELASQAGTKEAWEQFLSNHGEGFYAHLARQNLVKLEAVNTKKVEDAKKADEAKKAKSRNAAPTSTATPNSNLNTNQIYCGPVGGKMVCR
jgi:hypothetical protein